MNISGIHHVQITIPEGREDEAREFYYGVLGLSEVDKPATLRGRGGLWVQTGNLTLHIGTEPGVDRSMTRAHVAYQVDNLSCWRDRIARHGLEILQAVPIPGFQRFEFRDPFGNRVELIQPDVRQEQPE